MKSETISVPSAPENSSNCLPQARKSPASKVIQSEFNRIQVPCSEDDGISVFLACVEAGVKSWRKAGHILKQLVDADKGIYRKIMQRCPHLSVEVLSTFYQIGADLLEPRCLLLPQTVGANKLLDLDIEDQRAMLDKPVKLVNGLRDGQPIVVEKLVVEMDKRQLGIAFNNRKFRTVDEQTEFLKGQGVPVRAEDRRGGAALPESTPYKKVSYGLFDVVKMGDDIMIWPHEGKAPLAVVMLPISKDKDGDYKVVVELMEMRHK